MGPSETAGARVGDATSRPRDVRYYAVRFVVAAVIGLQLFLIARAYWAPQDTFGFQMFPEASEWQAEVYRVTPAGRVDVREQWPGGYEWHELVTVRGLGTPFAQANAGYGAESTLDMFQKALDWVAANTPDDNETLWLEADVTVWHNGASPAELKFRSGVREAGSE